MKKVLIAYFSGTHSTEWVVEKLSSEFENLRIDHDVFAIDKSKNKINDFTKIFKDVEMLVLTFPIRAFNMTSNVRLWLKSIPENVCKSAAVINICSGGISKLNEASRSESIEILKYKQIKTFYESCITLPSNYINNYSDALESALINKAKIKIKQIAKDISYKKIDRTQNVQYQKIVKIISKFYEKNCRKFSKSLSATDACFGCKKCATNCPTQNIVMVSGKPFFFDNCIQCMRCIYDCPSSALLSKKFEYQILPNFSFKAIIEKSKKITPNISKAEAKKYKGVYMYLKN